MSKKSFFVFLSFIFTIFLSISTITAADVDVVVYVYEDESIFNYIFTFDEEEGHSKFSIEKPKDAKLDYVVDQNGPVEYEIAGDYYIFRPEDGSAGKTIILKFRSRMISSEIYTTEAFKTYVNFDFPVEIFEFKVDFKDNFGEIISIYPEDYTLLPNNKIYWESQNLMKDTVFIVNFKDDSGTEPGTQVPFYYYIIIGILILVTLFSLFIVIQMYKKRKNEESNGNHKSANNEEKINEQIDEGAKNSNNHNMNEKLETNNNNLEPNKDNFTEIYEKHLTQNEKDVVMVVKENEGIAQNDILNHLPNLTKSNLSKIISKLNSKKILKRIKVGKVNNIYLGDKIEGKIDIDDNKTKEEE